MKNQNQTKDSFLQKPPIINHSRYESAENLSLKLKNPNLPDLRYQFSTDDSNDELMRDKIHC